MKHDSHIAIYGSVDRIDTAETVEARNLRNDATVFGTKKTATILGVCGETFTVDIGEDNICGIGVGDYVTVTISPDHRALRDGTTMYRDAPAEKPDLPVAITSCVDEETDEVTDNWHVVHRVASVKEAEDWIADGKANGFLPAEHVEAGRYSIEAPEEMVNPGPKPTCDYRDIAERAVKELRSLKGDGMLPDRYVQDAARNDRIDKVIADYKAMELPGQD